jgi:hypothetical protein
MEVSKLNKQDSIEIKLPSATITLDLSNSYKKNREILDRATIEYLDIIADSNKNKITRSRLYEILELPRMTFKKMKERLYSK